jgi:minimal PKS acyl carrier protein
MPTFTVHDLIDTLRECAGEDEPDQLSADVVDIPFDDLGYDSLSIVNTVRRIERERAIVLGDAVLDTVQTPRDLLDAVVSRLKGQVPSAE